MMYQIHYAIHSIFMYIILVRLPASLYFFGARPNSLGNFARSPLVEEQCTLSTLSAHASRALSAVMGLPGRTR